jgi:chromosome segregation ATPase
MTTNLERLTKMDLDINDQVKTLQRHMGGIVQLLKELQSRVKSLEGRNSDSKNNGSEEHQVIQKTIEANADAVKKLDKEIKGLIKDKNKKDASKKEIDEAIKKLDTEMSKMRKGVKENKVVEEVEIVRNGVKKERKCRYSN